jgi:DNA-binding transcriptional LysR family regulator
MNLNHLAIFEAVAEAGSLSAASARLHISQPAVSKQLREFEETLGLRLFDRLPRGVRLTGAGETLLEYSRRLFALERGAEQALAELRDLKAGRLALGASTTIGGYFLPELLAEYRRRYPEVEIALEIANTEEIQQRLVDNALDLGFTEGFVESDELDAEVFALDDLVIIAPPGHHLVGRTDLLAEEICHEPCVLREPGSGTRAVIERMLRERGLQHDGIMSLGSTEAIKRAVAAGAGISLVSRRTVTAEVAAGALVELPVTDLKLQRPLHKVSLRHKQAGRAMQAFLDMLAVQYPPPPA